MADHSETPETDKMRREHEDIYLDNGGALTAQQRDRMYTEAVQKVESLEHRLRAAQAGGREVAERCANMVDACNNEAADDSLFYLAQRIRAFRDTLPAASPEPVQQSWEGYLHDPHRGEAASPGTVEVPVELLVRIHDTLLIVPEPDIGKSLRESFDKLRSELLGFLAAAKGGK